MKHGISAIVIVHNEDKIIEETLKSLKGACDEMVVVHDGKCKDNTVNIAKKYTKKVYETKHKGRSAFNFITALKKTKYDWILKIDADEPLSESMRKNVKKLIETKDYDGFSFIHPMWDGKKPISKYWPRKTSLVRRSKISYLAFPGFDASIPIKDGSIKKTNYVLLHKPLKTTDVGWKGFKTKVLQRYAQNSARFLLMDFKDFETYNYDGKDLPLKIRIKRFLPLITNPLYGVLVFFKMLFVEGAIREGARGFEVALKTLIYNCYLGNMIRKEKDKKKHTD